MLQKYLVLFFLIIFNLQVYPQNFEFPGMNDLHVFSETKAITVGNNGVILKTNDSGQNWYICKNDEKKFDLKAVHFNSQNGWAVGDSGTVLYSYDEGITWGKVTIHTKQNLTDVCFINDKTGWIISGEGQLFKTEHYGDIWQEGVKLIAYVSPINSFKLQFINELTGYSVNYGSLVYKTIDGGITWQRKSIDWGFYDVFFINSTYGWITGFHEKCYKTIDGGENWLDISRARGSSGYSSVFFLNENLGWICGPAGIYKTINGGNKWSSQSYCGGCNWEAVKFYNENIGWIVGEDILYTNNGGNEWIYQKDNISDKIEELDINDKNLTPTIMTTNIDIYPNPFVTQTTIHYKSNLNQKASLEIFNICGQKVANQDFNQGNEINYNWTPVNLPTGLYMVVLTTNQTILKKKIIFIK